MQRLQFVIGNPHGVHLKPSATIAQVAQSFSSEIAFSKDGAIADAKSSISIMTLQANCGSQIELTVHGNDEEQAVEALKKVLEKELAVVFH